MKHHPYLARFCYLIFLYTPIALYPNSIDTTQKKIKQLTKKMQYLEKNLTETKQKKAQKEQSLLKTTRALEMHRNILQEISTAIQKNRLKTQIIEQNIQQLKQKLSKEQILLAKHCNLLLHIENEKRAYLLFQKTPYDIQNILIFHEYVVRARKKIILKIEQTKKQLISEKNALTHALLSQQKLKKKHADEKTRLITAQKNHLTQIKTLETNLSLQKKQLTALKKNRNNLTKLLNTLAMNSKKDTPSLGKISPPALHTTTFPISDKHLMKTQGDGLLFSVTKPTNIHAIRPGKVVFAQWFNGYGLLIIIDHGRGLMSLYANNHALFAPKGKFVQQGDIIAEIHPKNLFYFELRKYGKVLKKPHTLLKKRNNKLPKT